MDFLWADTSTSPSLRRTSVFGQLWRQPNSHSISPALHLSPSCISSDPQNLQFLGRDSAWLICSFSGSLLGPVFVCGCLDFLVPCNSFISSIYCFMSANTYFRCVRNRADLSPPLPILHCRYPRYFLLVKCVQAFQYYHLGFLALARIFMLSKHELNEPAVDQR